MSGYLRRLAERTLSAAPPVHSTAGRAYAPMPASSEVEILLGDPEPLSPAVPETASATPADRDTTPSRPHEPSTSHIRPSPELRRPEPHDIAVRINPPSGGNAEAEVLQPVSEHEKTGPPPQERLRVRPIPIETFHPRVLPEGEEGRDDEFVPLVKSAAPLNPALHQAVGSPIDTRPPLPARPHPYSPAAWGPSDIVLDRSVPDSNEVHVTIGRIEITAVHAPAPSKPAPTAAKKPMSLDEYLAKRNGGQP